MWTSRTARTEQKVAPGGRPVEPRIHVSTLPSVRQYVHPDSILHRKMELHYPEYQRRWTGLIDKCSHNSLGRGMGADEYPPLAAVRGHLRVKWYRSPIEPATLRGLMQRSDLQGWLQGGRGTWRWGWRPGRWCGGAGCAGCGWGSRWRLFAHGTVASFFTGVAPHELAHGTVFRTKRLNQVFLYLYSLLSWWDPFDYGTSHTYHHRYTPVPGGRPREPAAAAPVGGAYLPAADVHGKPAHQTGAQLHQGRAAVGAGDHRARRIRAGGLHEGADQAVDRGAAHRPAGRGVEVDVVVAGAAPVPRRRAGGRARQRAVGAAAGDLGRAVHRQLAHLLRRPPAALRPARQRARLPQVDPPR